MNYISQSLVERFDGFLCNTVKNWIVTFTCTLYWFNIFLINFLNNEIKSGNGPLEVALEIRLRSSCNSSDSVCLSVASLESLYSTKRKIKSSSDFDSNI